MGPLVGWITVKDDQIPQLGSPIFAPKKAMLVLTKPTPQPTCHSLGIWIIQWWGIQPRPKGSLNILEDLRGLRFAILGWWILVDSGGSDSAQRKPPPAERHPTEWAFRSCICRRPNCRSSPPAFSDWKKTQVGAGMWCLASTKHQ